MQKEIQMFHMLKISGGGYGESNLSLVAVGKSRPLSAKNKKTSLHSVGGQDAGVSFWRYKKC